MNKKKKKAQCPYCIEGTIKKYGEVYMCDICKQFVEMEIAEGYY